jgi:hypothetical protein
MFIYKILATLLKKRDAYFIIPARNPQVDAFKKTRRIFHLLPAKCRALVDAQNEGLHYHPAKKRIRIGSTQTWTTSNIAANLNHVRGRRRTAVVMRSWVGGRRHSRSVFG